MQQQRGRAVYAKPRFLVINERLQQTTIELNESWLVLLLMPV